MIETVIISLIICKIKKYDIKGLFRNWTIYPIVFMELVYLFIQINIFMENYRYLNIGNIQRLLLDLFL